MKDRLGNKIEPGCIVVFATGKLLEMKIGLAVISNIVEHWATWYKDGNEWYSIKGYHPYVTWKNRDVKLRKISFTDEDVKRLTVIPASILNMEMEAQVLLKAKAMEIIKDGKY